MSNNLEIEIFRAGQYPEGAFSIADLDTIVKRYDPKVHEAPVRLDHKDGPAYGWVEGLRRDGDVLIAKLKDLAQPFVDAVRARRFKKRSAEFWTKKFSDGPYLKAVAFLGAAIPAVKGLADVAFADGGESITVTFEEEESMGETVKTVAEGAGAVAAAVVKTFTEAEHQAIVEAERKRAAEETLAQFSEARATAEKERKRAEEAEARVRKMEDDARKNEIHTFCEALKKDGKLLPAWQEKGLEQFMMSLDGSEAVKFSEQEQGVKSRLAWFQEFLGGLPEVVQFGETKLPAGKAAAPAPEAAVREINKKIGLSDEDFAKYGREKR